MFMVITSNCAISHRNTNNEAYKWAFARSAGHVHLGSSCFHTAVVYERGRGYVSELRDEESSNK